jgi:hypothetical protein
MTGVITTGNLPKMLQGGKKKKKPKKKSEGDKKRGKQVRGNTSRI